MVRPRFTYENCFITPTHHASRTKFCSINIQKEKNRYGCLMNGTREFDDHETYKNGCESGDGILGLFHIHRVLG